MSTLDREPRLSRGENNAFCERRVDPGVPGKPAAVGRPQLAVKVPAQKPAGKKR